MLKPSGWGLGCRGWCDQRVGGCRSSDGRTAGAAATGVCVPLECCLLLRFRFKKAPTHPLGLTGIDEQTHQTFPIILLRFVTFRSGVAGTWQATRRTTRTRVFSTLFHCLSLPFIDLSLPSLTFHCLPWPLTAFHCLGGAHLSVWLSTILAGTVTPPGCVALHAGAALPVQPHCRRQAVRAAPRRDYPDQQL